MHARRLGLGTAALVTTSLVAVGALVNPAAAASWSYTYTALIGSERYILSVDRSVAGSSTQGSSRIVLADLKADGFGQRTYWRVGSSGPWKTCVNTGGNGTFRTCQVSKGKTIQYQFCEKNGSVDVACAPRDTFDS